MLSALFRLPTFFAVLCFLYWSVQVSGILYYVKFLDFTQPRADLLNWARMMTRFFRVKYYVVTQQRLMREPSCIYLCNHRSWSDFFVEHYITGGRSAAISRAMVFVALPVFMLYGYVSRSMFFFKRNAIRDKEKFNLWLDTCRHESPFEGLIVYPEGHRNMTEKSLPLKKGMLKYAYLRKSPCQIVIGKNKELPFSEKKWRVRFGCPVYVGYAQRISPQDYEEFEDFFKAVQTEWNLLWDTVFSIRSPSGLERLVWNEDEAFDFPMGLRLRCALAMLWGIGLLTGMICGLSYLLLHRLGAVSIAH